MARKRDFRVLVATDGSDQSQAAISTAIEFPWPAESRARAVIARDPLADHRRSILLDALDRNAESASEKAQRMLSRRWPDVEVVVVDEAPVKAILDEAERFAADVIVLGWRGHGPVRRVLMGSVSRGVVRGARSAVLVVRRAKRVRRIVVGYDESATAERALSFLDKLEPPKDGRVTLVNALNLMPPPSRRVPGAAAIARQIRRINTKRGRTAMRELNRAAKQLKSNGWRAETKLTQGEPLRELSRAIVNTRAHLLVVGARGSSGLRHLLLGSVADGALTRSPVPVLVVR